ESFGRDLTRAGSASGNGQYLLTRFSFDAPVARSLDNNEGVELIGELHGCRTRAFRDSGLGAWHADEVGHRSADPISRSGFVDVIADIEQRTIQFGSTGFHFVLPKKRFFNHRRLSLSCCCRVELEEEEGMILMHARGSDGTSARMFEFSRVHAT